MQVKVSRIVYIISIKQADPNKVTIFVWKNYSYGNLAGLPVFGSNPNILSSKL